MNISVELKPVTVAQQALLDKLGVTSKPKTQQEASRLIYVEQAKLANRMPTEKQTKKVAACGNGTSWIGRDLPGVRFREVSFQIELLEILEALDKAESQAAVNSAAVAMIEKVRQRLTKQRKNTSFVDTTVTPEAADGSEPAPF
jgi:hypothetical protein